jgi:hypothetical protein
MPLPCVYLSVVALAETVAVNAGALPEANSPAAGVWVLGGIAALAVMVNQILGVLEKFRKLKTPDPINPVESDRIKALEDEIRAVELRMERRIGEVMGSINTRLQSLESTISHLVSDFSRALGVLEGKSAAQALIDSEKKRHG